MRRTLTRLPHAIQEESDEITAAQFDKTVEEYLRGNKVATIEDLFESKHPLGQLLPDLLLQNPVVKKYLTRRSFALDKDDNPVYHSKYENLFYKHLKTTYRAGPPAYKHFMKDGALQRDIQFMQEQHVNEFAKNGCNFVIPYFDPNKRYDMISAAKYQASSLRHIVQPANKRGFAFIVHSVPTDAGVFGAIHIICAITVLNVKKKEIPFMIFLDSSKGNQWHIDKFKLGMDSVIDDLGSNCRYFDGSFKIQTEIEDQNCAGYTTEFAGTVCKLLADDDALQAKLENPASYQDWEALKLDLHNRIMQQLPHLFEPTAHGFAAKPWQERNPYFAQKRWDLGIISLNKAITKSDARVGSAMAFLEGRPALGAVLSMPSAALSASCSALTTSSSTSTFSSAKRKIPTAAADDQAVPAAKRLRDESGEADDTVMSAAPAQRSFLRCRRRRHGS
jgi:hypothetical protein